MTEPTQTEIVDAMIDYVAENLMGQAIAAMTARGVDPVAIEAHRPRLYAQVIEAAENMRPEYEAQVQANRSTVH